ncbi:MAG: LysM peptidoglycan-binding domain-containing protein [Chloroflexi bacterium]|nr:LysM peptidoglycan-binding domain-containing protein [Chloroflexota bacterium]
MSAETRLLPSPHQPRSGLSPQAGFPDAWRVRLQRLLAIAVVTGGVVAAASVTQPARLPPENPAVGEPTIVPPLPEVRAGIPPSLTDSGTEQTSSQLPGPPPPAEPARPDSFIRFTIQPGDSIFDISVVYGVSVEEILRFNPELGDGTRVFAGQEVLVPQFDE